MAIRFNASGPAGLPVSLTTNSDTRPVSVRTATDNEIDQLNNTPNAKKLYNAKLIGGAVGAAIPLTAAVIGMVKAGKFESNKVKTGLRVLIAGAGLYLSVGAAKAGAAVSKTLTVFFSTRDKSSTK